MDYDDAKEQKVVSLEVLLEQGIGYA